MTPAETMARLSTLLAAGHLAQAIEVGRLTLPAADLAGLLAEWAMEGTHGGRPVRVLEAAAPTPDALALAVWGFGADCAERVLPWWEQTCGSPNWPRPRRRGALVDKYTPRQLLAHVRARRPGVALTPAETNLFCALDLAVRTISEAIALPPAEGAAQLAARSVLAAALAEPSDAARLARYARLKAGRSDAGAPLRPTEEERVWQRARLATHLSALLEDRPCPPC